MFKPIIVHGRSWWVPSEHPTVLAVELSDPADYRKAQREKVARLVRATPLPEAQRLVLAYLKDPEFPTEDHDAIKANLPFHPLVSELFQQGDPEKAEPLEDDLVPDVLAAQSNLTLEDWLAAVPAFWD